MEQLVTINNRLQNFNYNSRDNSLSYAGDIVYLNGKDLNGIDSAFLNLNDIDLFDYIKNVYLLDSLSSHEVAEFFKSPSNLEDTIRLVSIVREPIELNEQNKVLLKNFAKKYIARCRIYANNKDLFDRLQEISPSIRAFDQELLNSHNVMDLARNFPQSEANKILYDAYEQELNGIDNSNEQNNNQNLDKGMSLTRTKNGLKNYDDFEAMEKAYINQKNSLGTAGFTSIAIIIAVTVVIGIYLASVIWK